MQLEQTGKSLAYSHSLLILFNNCLNEQVVRRRPLTEMFNENDAKYSSMDVKKYLGSEN